MLAEWEIDEVADLAMTAQRRAVGEDHIVSDEAVVTDMGISHEETVLADEKAAKYIEGKQIIKVIVVPKRMVNVVVK